MFTVVLDRAADAEGYTSRKSEIDALMAAIADKDATIADMSTAITTKENHLNKLYQLLSMYGIGPVVICIVTHNRSLQNYSLLYSFILFSSFKKKIPAAS